MTEKETASPAVGFSKAPDRGNILQLIQQARQRVESLPEKAIQRSKGSETKKGYDTTNYNFGYIWEIMTEVFGSPFIHVADISDPIIKGEGPYEVTREITVSIHDGDGEILVSETGDGGSRNKLLSDAKKGAKKNAIKLALFYIGILIEPWKGQMDEDGETINESKKYNSGNYEKKQQSQNLQPQKTQQKSGLASPERLQKYQDTSHVAGDYYGKFMDLLGKHFDGEQLNQLVFPDPITMGGAIFIGDLLGTKKMVDGSAMYLNPSNGDKKTLNQVLEIVQKTFAKMGAQQAA